MSDFSKFYSAACGDLKLMFQTSASYRNDNARVAAIAYELINQIVANYLLIRNNDYSHEDERIDNFFILAGQKKLASVYKQINKILNLLLGNPDFLEGRKGITFISILRILSGIVSLEKNDIKYLSLPNIIKRQKIHDIKSVKDEADNKLLEVKTKIRQDFLPFLEKNIVLTESSEQQLLEFVRVTEGIAINLDYIKYFLTESPLDDTSINKINIISIFLYTCRELVKDYNDYRNTSGRGVMSLKGIRQRFKNAIVSDSNIREKINNFTAELSRHIDNNTADEQFDFEHLKYMADEIASDAFQDSDFDAQCILTLVNTLKSIFELINISSSNNLTVEEAINEYNGRINQYLNYSSFVFKP